MKKTLIILALLVPSVSFGAIDTNLKYSQSGNEVLELQDFLVDKGFLKTNPTGYFGLLTLKAVQEYQASVGVPNTGYVGVLTRGKINDELNTIVSVSTQAEIIETGTTTPVVNLNQPVRGVSEPTQPTMNPTDIKLAEISEPYIVNNSNTLNRDSVYIDIKLNDAKSVMFSITSDALRSDTGTPAKDVKDMRITSSRFVEIANKVDGGEWNPWTPAGKYTWKLVSYSDTVYPMTQVLGETTGTFEIK